jgi:tripartite-type tricarboxylate transporter receptor subunit TctC
MHRQLIGMCLGMSALLGATVARAGPYPTKPVTMVVPFSAGGPTDTIARLVAQGMTADLKQQVIVENVGGAGGTVGAGRLARAEPDGYSLLLHHVGHATAPALYRKLAFDPLKDFETVGLVTDAPMTFVARKDLPPKDFKEFIDYVRKNKDKVTCANAGVGAASHLCGMLFMSAIEANLTTVPYKGTGPAMNDLLGGQVDFMCDQLTNTMSQIRAARVKVYATTTSKRVPLLPDLPTATEAGLPGFRIEVWHALYAPKGTPPAVIARVNTALKAALHDPNVKKRFAELGTEPVPDDLATPEAHRARLKAEIDKWGPILKKAAVYAD